MTTIFHFADGREVICDGSLTSERKEIETLDEPNPMWRQRVIDVAHGALRDDPARDVWRIVRVFALERVDLPAEVTHYRELAS